MLVYTDMYCDLVRGYGLMFLPDEQNKVPCSRAHVSLQLQKYSFYSKTFILEQTNTKSFTISFL